jgi:hypothetical protein
VDYRTVAQCHPGADSTGLTGTGVDHAVVFHGAAVAQHDGAVVAAQPGARPYPAARAGAYIADHIRRWMHPRALSELRPLALELSDGHRTVYLPG